MISYRYTYKDVLWMDYYRYRLTMGWIILIFGVVSIGSMIIGGANIVVALMLFVAYGIGALAMLAILLMITAVIKYFSFYKNHTFGFQMSDDVFTYKIDNHVQLSEKFERLETKVYKFITVIDNKDDVNCFFPEQIRKKLLEQ